MNVRNLWSRARFLVALALAALTSLECRAESAGSNSPLPSPHIAVVADTKGSGVARSPSQTNSTFLATFAELSGASGKLTLAEVAKRLGVHFEKSANVYWMGKHANQGYTVVAEAGAMDANVTELSFVLDVALAVRLADLEAHFGSAKVASRSKTSHVRFPSAPNLPRGATLRAEVLGAPEPKSPVVRMVLRRPTDN